MALIDFKFFSEKLQVCTEVYIIMPQKSTVGQIGIDSEASNEKYKCMYLLHGLSDDHTIWLRRTAIERYAAEHGICVVMPAAGRSFYTDMKYGGAYYSYISEELPRLMKEFFNISDKREDTYIAGLSMGGYGALKIALRNPENYCAAIALSPVANIFNEIFHDTEIPIFGEDLNIPDEDDIYKLVKMKNGEPNKPRIYHSIGTDDFMYDDNVKLNRIMEELDYDYTYKAIPARVHSWDLWDEEIANALNWALGLC